MRLEGSCHCGAVHFSVESETPYPYQRCHCSICRKTAGGGGFAINIMGLAETMEVQGAEHLRVYRVDASRTSDPEAAEPDGKSPGRRHFCGQCGSALWIFSPRWPQWIYPFASAIDTPLPQPPRHTHMMLAYKPEWVDLCTVEEDRCFAEYPDLSIARWHEENTPKP